MKQSQTPPLSTKNLVQATLAKTKKAPSQLRDGANQTSVTIA